MRDLAEHPTELRAVLVVHLVPRPPEAERAQRAAGGLLLADGALLLDDQELIHRAPAASGSGREPGTRTPRIVAISSGERSCWSAFIVALTTLTGFVDPSDFVRMSRMPADSATARTEPPAMTPVPLDAGRSSTLAEPKRPVTACGSVWPASGTSITCFLASSTPLRMASGTSSAFPSPAPTWPRPSPTTTIAEKLNRRPPFTTLDTRLIWTTRSVSSSLLASMRG